MSADRVRKFLAMAVGTANAEEARNAAVMACKAIVKDAQDAAVARGRKPEDWTWVPSLGAGTGERRNGSGPPPGYTPPPRYRRPDDWSYAPPKQEPPPKARAPKHRKTKLKAADCRCTLCGGVMQTGTWIAVVKAKSPVHWDCFARTYQV